MYCQRNYDLFMEGDIQKLIEQQEIIYANKLWYKLFIRTYSFIFHEKSASMLELGNKDLEYTLNWG